MALLTVIAESSGHPVREALKDFAIACGCFVVAFLYWRFREKIVAFTVRALGESSLVRTTTDLNVKLIPMALAAFGVVWLIAGVAALTGAS